MTGFRRIEDPYSTKREMKSVASSYSKKSGGEASVGLAGFEVDVNSSGGPIRFEAGQLRGQEGSKKGRSEMMDVSQQEYNPPTI